MSPFVQCTFESPLGRLRLFANDAGLVAIYFPDHSKPGLPDDTGICGRNDHLDHAARELDEYFGGRLRRFTTPLAPVGTPFQRQVWSALAQIGFGETRSYADIAQAIGRPRAVRAVGAANALNPLSVIVPCHRVIGKDGTLTGYAR